MKNLAIITSGYPSPATPTHYTFVQQLVHAISRQGVKVTVIQPVARHKVWRGQVFPIRETEKVDGENSVEVYRPRFISFGARKSYAKWGILNPGCWTLRNFTAAAEKVILKLPEKPDALYGHFLYLNGAAAVRIGCKHNIPAFPGVGEGEFWTVAMLGKDYAIRDHSHATGFITVSTALKNKLVSELEIKEDIIGVFPNGVDRSLFKPHNRTECRRKLGFPEDMFIVVCVGNYLYKKGPARVAEAIDGLQGVVGVFAGSGSEKPKADNILLSERVNHEDLPTLLSACDVFVLPTLVEGCCNAIIEAMACGLPIISSGLPFNDDLLNEDMSIRVDPLDTKAIREAIIKLQDDRNLCSKMSEAALQKSVDFDIEKRASKIINFLNRSTCG